MDSAKTGKLILKLRRKHGFTQKRLADMMNISDRTVIQMGARTRLS